MSEIKATSASSGLPNVIEVGRLDGHVGLQVRNGDIGERQDIRATLLLTEDAASALITELAAAIERGAAVTGKVAAGPHKM